MADDGLESIALKTLDRANKVMGQLGNWTLLGNAAGLGFILATARDGKLPNNLPIETAYAAFLLGLVCAFFGYLMNAIAVAFVGNAALDFSSALTGLRHREEMRRLLAEQGKEVPETYESDDIRDDATLANESPHGLFAFAILGLLLFFVSVIALGFGLSLPLFYGLR